MNHAETTAELDDIKSAIARYEKYATDSVQPLGQAFWDGAAKALKYWLQRDAVKQFNLMPHRTPRELPKSVTSLDSVVSN